MDRTSFSCVLLQDNTASPVNTMDINFFKDILFDLVNESDELDPYLEDIECDDRNNLMTVITKDGKRYTIHVSVSEN